MITLRECRVELVGRIEAVALIMRHEALGTLGNASIFFGLRAPDDRLIGVAGFGHGPHEAGGCIVLERGCCTPDAPRNAASFLIGRALRYGRRVLGWRVVKAFSDQRFSEAGLVYRAAGFQEAPPSRHGKAFRYALAVGEEVLSDRAIYRRYGSHDAARQAGAQIIRLPARKAWIRTWSSTPRKLISRHAPAEPIRPAGDGGGLQGAPRLET